MNSSALSPTLSLSRSEEVLAGRRRGDACFAANTRAFTLIELMVAVALMGVIVTALYAVFANTQKALQANVNQVDVLESSRAAMNLLSTEIAQAAPTAQPLDENFDVKLSSLSQPVIQPLPGLPGAGGGAARTNVLENLYFSSRNGDQVIGTSYRVLDVVNGVGTLCRFQYTMPARNLGATNLSKLVFEQPATNYTPVLNGVIDFRVQAYDWAGWPMTTNRYTNVIIAPYPGQPTIVGQTFLNNALPASVEIELGVLAPTANQELRSLQSNALAASQFLSNNVGQVTVLRLRIPVRTSSGYYASYPVSYQ